MADPTQGFVAEEELGIKITRQNGEDYLVLMRFNGSEKVMDYTLVPLEAFKRHSVQPIWMDDDDIAHELHERDNRIRLILGLPQREFKEWYVLQPVVLRFTDGTRTWDYRMTFHNWLTCEKMFVDILNGNIQTIPMELAIEHTREQPHKLKEPEQPVE